MYQTEVYPLAQYINEQADEEIIPGAELAPEQKDTDSLPPYKVLKYLIEEKQLSPVEYDRVKAYIGQLNSTAPA